MVPFLLILARKVLVFPAGILQGIDLEIEHKEVCGGLSSGRIRFIKNYFC